MQKRLLLGNIALVVVVMIFAVALSWRSIDNYFVDRVKEDTIAAAKLVKKLMDESEVEGGQVQAYIDELAQITSLRITIIGRDGAVLADSYKDPSHMDNHGNRPEVIEAMAGKDASYVRYSNTLKSYMFYYAMPLASAHMDGVIRVAVQVKEIENYTTDMVRIVLFGVLMGSGLALLLSVVVTRRIMQPINELTEVAKTIAAGNYDEKVYLEREDQLGTLADAFNTMTYVMRKNIWELTRKNAELESILTSMGSGLAAVNNDFRLTLYNEAFVKMLNLPDEDLKDKRFYEVSRELTIFEIVEKSVKDEEYLSKETVIGAEGEERIIRVTATPIYNKNSVHKHLGALIVLMDVTQIRKLEGMRRDFVSNVTHELKTPLTSIRGFVDTLKSGAIKEEAVALRFLDIIDIETERLSTLIQDILSLSEIETVVGDKNTDFHDFRDIMDEVVDILPRNHEGVALLTEIAPDLPKYNCNKNRIKQLMINLIDNSIKYTEEGYVKVKASQAYGYLTIQVEDTGVGIERKHLSRIFERFYRVDKGRSRKMGGTGLGLSIVKHIVELYSGEITIDSEVGEGTTISIKLPY